MGNRTSKTVRPPEEIFAEARKRFNHAQAKTPEHDSYLRNMQYAFVEGWRYAKESPDETSDDPDGPPFIVDRYGSLAACVIAERDWLRKRLAALEQKAKPCTCHPDDNPPRPCPQKYALTECRQAAEKTRDRLSDAQCDEIIGALETYEWKGFSRDDIRLIAGTIETYRTLCQCGHDERYHFSDGTGNTRCRATADCMCSAPDAGGD
jgi:hypothetical protein